MVSSEWIASVAHWFTRRSRRSVGGRLLALSNPELPHSVTSDAPLASSIRGRQVMWISALERGLRSQGSRGCSESTSRGGCGTAQRLSRSPTTRDESVAGALSPEIAHYFRVRCPLRSCYSEHLPRQAI